MGDHKAGGAHTDAALASCQWKIGLYAACNAHHARLSVTVCCYHQQRCKTAKSSCKPASCRRYCTVGCLASGGCQGVKLTKAIIQSRSGSLIPQSRCRLASCGPQQASTLLHQPRTSGLCSRRCTQTSSCARSMPTFTDFQGLNLSADVCEQPVSKLYASLSNIGAAHLSVNIFPHQRLSRILQRCWVQASYLHRTLVVLTWH